MTNNSIVYLVTNDFYFYSSSQNVSILLECTPNRKTSESVLYGPTQTNLTDVNLILFSKFSCLAQVEEIVTHGVFYTFFLIFFIVLFSYLMVGIMYNYFFVGARGFELLPNYDFWSKMFGYLKLAFMYVKYGFKFKANESDSYDAI